MGSPDLRDESRRKQMFTFSFPAHVPLILSTSDRDWHERLFSFTQPTLEHSEGAGIEQGSPQLTPAKDTNTNPSSKRLKFLI